ncbi:hypothetical protein NDU88_003608 [Pleurodeles waltl]|uniref:Uncharacterized protein n=1 Tax=Pleurodeles waltl TaxID=8319 RepID=A0AAV7SGF2_PLEWA|nr:hypothetical protein NDU88_003608 [Pleurodeles waltl]
MKHGQDGRRVGAFHWCSAAGSRSDADRAPGHVAGGRGEGTMGTLDTPATSCGGGCKARPCGARSRGLLWAAAGAARNGQPRGKRRSLAVRRWRERHFPVRISAAAFFEETTVASPRVPGLRMGQARRGPAAGLGEMCGDWALMGPPHEEAS